MAKSGRSESSADDSAQFDAGGVGAAVEGLGSKITNEEAVLWYAIIAAC